MKFHTLELIFLESLKNIKGIESVALTTNGLTLARHLPDLVSAGLDNVNISLDTLVPQKFAFVSRRPGECCYCISLTQAERFTEYCPSFIDLYCTVWLLSTSRLLSTGFSI